MDGSSLSPAARIGLFCAVAAAHAGVLGVMASTVDTSGTLASGGAPVINLTLVPSPRMDGRNGAERTAGAVAAGVARTAPALTRPGSDDPEPLLRLQDDADSLPPSSPLRSPAPDAAPGATASRGAPVRTGETEADSRADHTEGGGARTFGAAAAPLEDRYGAEVIAWVERHKRSPGARLSGVAVLRFVLDRQGRLREATVVSADGDRRIGSIAVDALRSAEPFPRPPADTEWRTREFHVRLDYRPRPG